MAEDPNPHITPWLATLLRPIHTVFVPAYFRIKLLHADRVPAQGPIIFTPTHRSRWDPMLIPWISWRLPRSMASHDEFVGVQGWFMRNLGAFPVNTRRPSPSAIKACEAILRAGQLLVIYPEGTIYRLPPDHVHPLKPGTAWVALKVQQEMPETPIPVFPIRIRYGDRFPRFRTKVEVEVREPILVSDYLDRPEKEAIRDLTAAIQAGMGDVVDDSDGARDAPRDASGRLPDPHAAPAPTGEQQPLTRDQ
jgi:1-acyl-sn-glycerol-3-phosphate acyltransferase